MEKGDAHPLDPVEKAEQLDEGDAEPFEAFAIRVCRDFLDGLKWLASPGPASESTVSSDSAESQGSDDSRKIRHD
ncbi:MAG: hypothetical protein ACYC61_18185 [Isosphaeraceae bacterium]